MKRIDSERGPVVHEIEPGDWVRLVLGDGAGDFIDVLVTENGEGLEVRTASGALVVLPRVSNVVEIYNLSRGHW